VSSHPLEPPEVDDRRPAWIQWPEDLVPRIVPVELLLTRTPQRASGLTGIRAYLHVWSGMAWSVRQRVVSCCDDPAQP
jgi:hypothetical protein